MESTQDQRVAFGKLLNDINSMLTPDMRALILIRLGEGAGTAATMSKDGLHFWAHMAAMEHFDIDNPDPSIWREYPAIYTLVCDYVRKNLRSSLYGMAARLRSLANRLDALKAQHRALLARSGRESQIPWRAIERETDELSAIQRLLAAAYDCGEIEQLRDAVGTITAGLARRVNWVPLIVSSTESSLPTRSNEGAEKMDIEEFTFENEHLETQRSLQDLLGEPEYAADVTLFLAQCDASEFWIHFPSTLGMQLPHAVVERLKQRTGSSQMANVLSNYARVYHKRNGRSYGAAQTLRDAIAAAEAIDKFGGVAAVARTVLSRLEAAEREATAQGHARYNNRSVICEWLTTNSLDSVTNSAGRRLLEIIESDWEMAQLAELRHVKASDLERAGFKLGPANKILRAFATIPVAGSAQ